MASGEGSFVSVSYITSILCRPCGGAIIESTSDAGDLVVCRYCASPSSVVIGVWRRHAGFVDGKRYKLLKSKCSAIDRASYEPAGREFESLRARQKHVGLTQCMRLLFFQRSEIAIGSYR